VVQNPYLIKTVIEF